MMALIGFLFICAVLVLAVCLLFWLASIIVGLIAIVVIVGIAICLPLLGIGVAGPGHEWLGGLLGLGGSVVFLAVLWHYRPRTKTASKDKLEILHRQTLEPTMWQVVAIKPQQAEKVTPVRPQIRVNEPDADIMRAWKQAEGMFPAYTDVIAEARDACAKLLVEADADMYDQTLKALAIKIRKNIARYVDLSTKALSRVEPDKRRDILEDLLSNLTNLGCQSRSALAAHYERHDTERLALSQRFQADE